MRKKLLAIFSAVLIACSLGVVSTSVSALNSSMQPLNIVQVNAADMDGDGSAEIIIDTNASELGYNTLTGLNQYILINGNPATLVQECGSNIMVNRTSAAPAVGDTLLLKAGLVYDGLELKEDVSFKYNTVGAPWTCTSGSVGETIGTHIYAGDLKDSKTAIVPRQADDGGPSGWNNCVIVDFGQKVPAVESMITTLTSIDGNTSAMFVLTDSQRRVKTRNVAYWDGRAFVFAQDNTTLDVGDMLIVKAGTTWGDYQVKEDISFVYQTKFQSWVRGSIATDFALLGETNMYVGTSQNLSIKFTPSDAIGTPTYTSSDTSIATVDATGKVTAKNKTGSVTITAELNGIVKQITIQVSVASEKEFRIKKDFSTYYVPKRVEELNRTFTLLERYDLKYYYVNNGVADATLHDVTESMLSAIDYTTEGTVTVTITDPLDSSRSDAINVKIYALKIILKADDIGIGDYDNNDNRWKEETWNGHMLVGFASYSTNNKYLRHGVTLAPGEDPDENKMDTGAVKAVVEMTNHIEYKVAATGKVYSNIEHSKRISLWMLKTTFLIQIRPDDASGNMVANATGYGSESQWGRLPASNPEYRPYAPIYKNGDEITFKAGMPLYKWVENNGKDDYIIEAITVEDALYRCSENGTDNNWKLIRGYTDFTVTETYNIGENQGLTLDTMRVPATATAGSFTYVSSDPSTVEVDSSGAIFAKKVGSVTITITLSGKDADGNVLPTITKTITVNVIKSLKSVTGTFTLTKDTVMNDSILSQMLVTVTYSDGSTEMIALNDPRLVVPRIATNKVGTKTIRIKYLYSEADKDVTWGIKIIVKEGEPGDVSGGDTPGGNTPGGNTPGGNGGNASGGMGGCGSSVVASVGLLPLTLIGAAFIVAKNKKNKK